ncbi:hypothetical protein FALBO_17277 [Fusarium albosuccineum]|uniref:Uncharacterized protein n=1 Tax=Fusarium albosuccineum TaxID=1237068 RepID=A0A8H4NSR7_9HYPO|nr:hypothetical protein FALBO_17277 [Fusarium albosuccineum]
MIPLLFHEPGSTPAGLADVPGATFRFKVWPSQSQGLRKPPKTSARTVRSAFNVPELRPAPAQLARGQGCTISSASATMFGTQSENGITKNKQVAILRRPKAPRLQAQLDTKATTLKHGTLGNGVKLFSPAAPPDQQAPRNRNSSSVHEWHFVPGLQSSAPKLRPSTWQFHSWVNRRSRCQWCHLEPTLLGRTLEPCFIVLATLGSPQSPLMRMRVAGCESKASWPVAGTPAQWGLRLANLPGRSWPKMRVVTCFSTNGRTHELSRLVSFSSSILLFSGVSTRHRATQ